MTGDPMDAAALIRDDLQQIFADPRIDEGIRLFNAREFFACHDVIEDFWSELVCPQKPFFQGLIQTAVGLFHFEEGNYGGAKRMYLSGRTYMRPFAPTIAGIDVTGLLSQLDACFAELCQPRTHYPTNLQIDPKLIPVIVRTAD